MVREPRPTNSFLALNVYKCYLDVLLDLDFERLLCELLGILNRVADVQVVKKDVFSHGTEFNSKTPYMV